MKTKTIGVLLTLFFLIVSCSNETESIALTDESIEEAFPDISGQWVDVKLDGEMVKMERIGDLLIYEGDMIFTANELGEDPSTETVGYTSARRWPNATIYYTVNGSVWGRRGDIDEAAAIITANTDLTLIRSDNNNKVRFVSGSGCSSYVGMIGGVQDITISSSCSVGNIVHEFLHAAGILHEHSRRDRDNYITINYNNIISGYENNFNRAGSDYSDFTSGMDYGSVMMYSQTAFSSNGGYTIVRKDGQTYSTQRNGLSSNDIQGVNAMY